jgi:outer membrane protein assembly factor BamA
VANVYGDIFRDDKNKTKTYWQREQIAGIAIDVPIYESLQSTLSLSLGYRYQKIAPLADREGLTPRPDDGVLSGISAGLSFQNLKSSIYAISPEGGLLASVTYQRDHPDLGSDFDLHTVVGDTRWYWRIPKLQHHVLAFRATGGLSEGDTLNQGIFQVGGSSVTGEPASLAQRNYFLRGYEANALAGNRFALGSVEYRFPIAYPQRGIGSIFFDSLTGAAFYDIGNAWNGDTTLADFKQGVGGELRLNTLVQNALPLTLYVGYAHGLDDDLGKSQFLYGFTFDIGL